MLSRELYIPLLPEIASQLKGPNFFAVSIIPAVILGIGISQLVYGIMSDYIGRKALLIFGLFLALLSSSISSLAMNSIFLWVMQMLSGVGCGACVVLSRAILKDKLQSDLLVKGIAYQSMASTLPPLLAPSIGAFLAAVFGWRSSFLLFAIFCALTVLLVVFCLPETHFKRIHDPFSFKIVLKNYYSIIKDKLFLNSALFIAFSFLPILIYSIASPFVYKTVFNLDVKTIALLYGLTTFGYFLGSFFVTQYAKKFNSIMLLQCCAFTSTVLSLALVTMSLMHIYSIALLVAVMLGIYISNGIISPITSKICLDVFPQLAGASSALIFSIRLTLPAILTTIYAWYGVVNLTSMSGCIILAAFMALFFYTRIKNHIRNER